MPSATVRGSYASINTIFDPPLFLLDTTFKVDIVLFVKNFRQSEMLQYCRSKIF